MFIASKNSQTNLQPLRDLRDALLAATDFYYLSDTPQPPPEVDAYRQALRDCTKPAPGVVATIPDPEAYGLPKSLEAKITRIIMLDKSRQFG